MERIRLARATVPVPSRLPAATQHLQRRVVVGPADDAYEREADRIADRVVTSLRRSPAGAGAPVDGSRRRSGGDGWDEHTRSRMEHAFGADFGDVRIRRSASIDDAADGLNAEAFTRGRDVFVRRSLYRPGTVEGDRLLAHELAHTLQQGGSKIRRSTAGFDVHRDMPADRVSLKKRMVHLDFVKMKRSRIKPIKAVAQALGLSAGGDTWGHWWTEVGDRDAATQKFTYRKSYGWWPSDIDTIGDVFGGVPGELNGGGTQDDHAGDPADVEFHPVMNVDTNEDYEDVRDRVTAAIDQFAHGYSGLWQWKFGWGQNCHTFQQEMKTATGLHFKKSKHWLIDPTPYLRKPHPGPPADAAPADAAPAEETAAPVVLNCGATLTTAAIAQIKSAMDFGTHLTQEHVTFLAYGRPGATEDLATLQEALGITPGELNQMMMTAFSRPANA